MARAIGVKNSHGGLFIVSYIINMVLKCKDSPHCESSSSLSFQDHPEKIINVTHFCCFTWRYPEAQKGGEMKAVTPQVRGANDSPCKMMLPKPNFKTAFLQWARTRQCKHFSLGPYLNIIPISYRFIDSWLSRSSTNKEVGGSIQHEHYWARYWTLTNPWCVHRSVSV